MPSWPTQTSWPNKTSWPAGTSWPSGGNWPAGGGGPPPVTPINFADLFPGAYQVLQTDRGLSYGAVMRADVSNTSSVAFALTGATPAVPVPIWIRITAPGVGNVYYDGLGVTAAMTGVTIVDSVNIVLTGAGLGMAITPGVGSQVVGNTWKATCSGLADQSGNGKDAIQLTPSQQPLIAVGLNGKPELIFGGNAQHLKAATFTPPAGTMGYLVYRVIAGGGFLYILDSNPGGGSNGYSLFINGGAHSIFGYSGDYLPGGDVATDIYNRTMVTWNGVSSTIKVGSNPLAAGSVGFNVPSVGGRVIGARFDQQYGANVGLFAVVHTPPQPYAPADAAINTPGGYGPGAIAV